MRPTQRPLEQGFTLLELIVVVALLGLITSLATDYAVEQTNQQRYTTTQQRMAQIQYAIAGDASRTLNGQPDISGFYADMGRLPVTLAELIQAPIDCNADIAGDQACPATFSAALGRTIGWNGPYIDAAIVAADGWGNPWQWNSATGTLSSLGMDGATGQLTGQVFEDEVSSLIPEARFQVQVSEASSTGLGTWGIEVNISQDIFECTNDSHDNQTACEANGATWNQISNLCAILTTVEHGVEATFISFNERDLSAYTDHVSGNAGTTFTYRFYKGSVGSRTPLIFPQGSAQLSLYRFVTGQTCGDQAQKSYFKRGKNLMLVPGRALPTLTL